MALAALGSWQLPAAAQYNVSSLSERSRFLFYLAATEWPTAAQGTALGTSITQHRFSQQNPKCLMFKAFKSLWQIKEMLRMATTALISAAEGTEQFSNSLESFQKLECKKQLLDFKNVKVTFLWTGKKQLSAAPTQYYSTEDSMQSMFEE
jgi:hypothetical protein